LSLGWAPRNKQEALLGTVILLRLRLRRSRLSVTVAENFVSSQTYALRSSSGSRFGFAVVPSRNATAQETLTLYDRLAAAIQGSDGSPSGACGQAGEWCDNSVDGAQFNDGWKTFTDVTPPVVVPTVSGWLGANGWYVSDVTVTWQVSDPESAFTTSGCTATTIAADTAGTTVTSTATSYGGVTTRSVTIKRDATPPVLVVPTDVAVDALTPAGAAVVYEATASDALDPAPAVSCSPPSGSVFPIGTTPVTCTATDVAGNVSSATFAVSVRGAAAQIAELESSVKAAGLPHGLEVALVAKLDAAASALAAGHGPCPHLEAFVTLVQSAVRVGDVAADTGDALVATAERVEAVAGC
jgi:HYR domain